MQNILIAVVGPTATGKTSLGARLAYTFNGEIISADSRQVYKYMNIGTGKDFNDYIVNGKHIKYHLIDVEDPRNEYNLFRYKKDFIKIYNDIISANKIPFMVGGTGMYLSSIIQDYKLPEGNPLLYEELNNMTIDSLKEILSSRKKIHNKTDLVSKDRIIKAIIAAAGENILCLKVKSCVIGVKFEREEIKKRITVRLQQRLESGMIDEVKMLMDMGISLERLLAFGLEYKFAGQYLSGILNYNDMFQKLNTSIHSFAKRQMTWFRKMEKEGVEIHWVDKGNYEQSELIVKQFLKNES